MRTTEEILAGLDERTLFRDPPELGQQGHHAKRLTVRGRVAYLGDLEGYRLVPTHLESARAEAARSGSVEAERDRVGLLRDLLGRARPDSPDRPYREAQVRLAERTLDDLEAGRSPEPRVIAMGTRAARARRIMEWLGDRARFSDEERDLLGRLADLTESLTDADRSARGEDKGLRRDLAAYPWPVLDTATIVPHRQEPKKLAILIEELVPYGAFDAPEAARAALEEGRRLKRQLEAFHERAREALGGGVEAAAHALERARDPLAHLGHACCGFGTGGVGPLDALWWGWSTPDDLRRAAEHGPDLGVELLETREVDPLREPDTLAEVDAIDAYGLTAHLEPPELAAFLSSLDEVLPDGVTIHLAWPIGRPPPATATASAGWLGKLGSLLGRAAASSGSGLAMSEEGPRVARWIEDVVPRARAHCTSENRNEMWLALDVILDDG